MPEAASIRGFGAGVCAVAHIGFEAVTESAGKPMSRCLKVSDLYMTQR
jgi:hypothetical protein